VTLLQSAGPAHEAAVRELHALLLRAARFELHRRRAALAHLGWADREDLATQAADDALLAILRKLGDFRGQSRFETWAYKFALLEASVKARRRTWHGRELPLTDEGMAVLEGRSADPAAAAATGQLLGAVRDAIATDLTPHQRDVLVAVTLNDVPIDVLAERLQTTRGALYKTLHDARRRLRRALADQGMEP
jgi:RNA polymerase sigma-70 factor (ECF subfamily)